MKHIARRRLLGVAGGLVLASPAIRAGAQTAGVALVIGNSKYKWEASLPNVKRDAPDIARRFQAFGLRTELLQDAGRDAMLRAIDTFRVAARGANFAAFYFAGHGAIWDKISLLVPVDADLSDPGAAKNLVEVPPILEAATGAGHSLLVFDNCRNNPADGWRQKQAVDNASGTAGGGAGGVGAWAQVANSLVLFSTAPGRVALDGPAGDNSPFAASLLRQTAGQSVDLQALPARLRRDLLIATQGRQILWDRNELQQPFLLKGPAAKPGAADGSGWSHDPSKIIELTNAYSFAEKNGLLLPAGLIAHRPASGAPHAEKAGSFRFEIPSSMGIQPGIMVVMSVEEPQSAEVLGAVRVSGRPIWAFVRCRMAGDSIDMSPLGQRTTFKWKDAGGGSLTTVTGGARASFNGRFTRLDG